VRGRITQKKPEGDSKGGGKQAAEADMEKEGLLISSIRERCPE